MHHLSPQELAALHFYHGDISFEETLRLLDSQPAGTYLLRSSRSTPHALVVGYKTVDAIEQCIIKLCAGGYAIGSTVFPSIADILAANKHFLKHGLQVVPDLMFSSVPGSHTAAPPDEVKTVILQESRQSTTDAEAKLEAARCCPVCFEEKACCVIIPCGHVFCKVCCSKVDACPLCRRQKDSVVVAWL